MFNLIDNLNKFVYHIFEELFMINLMYAGNIKVFDGLLISLVSLAKHTKEPFTAYVLTMDLHEIDPIYIPISDYQIEFLQSVVQKYNKDNRIIKIDTTKEYHTFFADGKNQKTRCTPYTLLRLLAPHLELPKKIIYLDTDTVINNDIGELYNIDITNYEVGVVRDIMFANFVYFRNYFNAGMMLMNLKMLKETKAFDKAAYLCKTKKLAFADQDALNRSIKHRLMIPYKFNWFRHRCKYNDDIVVHHMCNARQKNNVHHRIKPWETELFLESFPMYRELIEECNELKKQMN